jgi:hypothetical protein
MKIKSWFVVVVITKGVLTNIDIVSVLYVDKYRYWGLRYVGKYGHFEGFVC